MVMRYFGAAESCWRLLGFPLYYSTPSVMMLPLHLEGEQRVAFRPGTEARRAQAPPVSGLHEWLNFCRNPVHTARAPLPAGWLDLTYIQFPSYFSYQPRRGWQALPSGNRRFRPVGRLPQVSVQHEEELFYLRVLLCHITAGQVQEILGRLGPYEVPSVSHLMNGYESFKEACQDRGLANDDSEWQMAIAEAAETSSYSRHVLDLLAYILVWNSPSNPHSLFERAWTSIACSPNTADGNPRMLSAVVRYDVNMTAVRRLSAWIIVMDELLASGVTDSEARLRLPTLSQAESEVVEHLRESPARNQRLIEEERNYNAGRERDQFARMYGEMNEEQRSFVDAFVSAFEHAGTAEELSQHPDPEWPGFVAFLSAYAGCGKTFVERALCHYVRGRSSIVLACAATGIASLLLDGGTTLHSRLKAPLTVSADDPSSTRLGINMRSMEASLVREAKVLLMDEAVMFRWALIEAVDRSFREIRGIADKPFGGVLVVMGGDFRQTLPIERHAQRAQTVEMCVSRWPAWMAALHSSVGGGVSVNEYMLATNLRAERLAREAPTDGERSRIRRWARWLERLGDGELGGAEDEGGEADLSEWPELCHPVRNVAGVQAMLRDVYDCPDAELGSQTADFWSQRAIVTPRHVCVDYLNELMLARLPGDEIELTSADVVDLDDRGGAEITSDFLNAQNPAGMPPHALKLKLNAVVILLRNLDRRRGLVNGTRLQVEDVRNNRLLRCRILTGARKGQTCVIPRIKLKPSTSNLPVNWYRVQFPVKLAYAMSTCPCSSPPRACTRFPCPPCYHQTARRCSFSPARCAQQLINRKVRRSTGSRYFSPVWSPTWEGMAL